MEKDFICNHKNTSALREIKSRKGVDISAQLWYNEPVARC